jgi:hypothetical protein
MKNKALILIVSVLVITLSSCGNKEVSISTIPTTAMALETGINVEVKEKPFANPALIEGSNFGVFFTSMLKTQNYEMALKFTSKASIEKFGAGKIKEKYQNFKFNYSLKLASKSEDNNVITLKFTTSEFATGKFKEMKVVVENDSCKLVLPDNLDDLLK